MISAVFLLLKLRARLLLNGFRHSSLTRKIGSIGAVLGFLIFALSMGVFCWFFLRLVMQFNSGTQTQLPEMAQALEQIFLLVPVGINAAAFVMGVLVNMGVLLQTLYLSNDLEFLLAAPIPPRAVFINKLLQAVLPVATIFLFFTTPVLTAFGLAQGYSVLYYLAFPPLIVLLLVGGAGISALLVMAIVRVMSPRRATEVLGMVGALIGMSFYAFSQGGRSAIFRESNFEQLGELSASTQFIVNGWNPLAWPGLALFHIGRSDWTAGLAFAGLTALVMALIFSISLFAAERVYLSGWARAQVGQRKPRRAPKAQSDQKESGRLMSRVDPKVRAIVVKDYHLYRRDLRNLSQLITPIVFVLVWTFVFLRGSSALRSVPSDISISILGMSNLASVLYICWTFVLRFGHGAFSMEGKRWWILKSAPVRPQTLVQGKFLVAYIPVLIIGMPFLIFLGLFRSLPLEVLIYQLIAFPIIAAASTSLSLVFGILGAKFNWDNPVELYRGTTSCVGTFTSALFLFILALLFIGLPVAAEALNVNRLIGLAGGLIAGTVMAVLAGGLPLRVVLNRINSLGE
jgi:ABC-2 type transport system permease protein